MPPQNAVDSLQLESLIDKTSQMVANSISQHIADMALRQPSTVSDTPEAEPQQADPVNKNISPLEKALEAGWMRERFTLRYKPAKYHSGYFAPVLEAIQNNLNSEQFNQNMADFLKNNPELHQRAMVYCQCLRRQGDSDENVNHKLTSFVLYQATRLQHPKWQQHIDRDLAIMSADPSNTKTRRIQKNLMLEYESARKRPSYMLCSLDAINGNRNLLDTVKNNSATTKSTKKYLEKRYKACSGIHRTDIRFLNNHVSVKERSDGSYTIQDDTIKTSNKIYGAGIAVSVVGIGLTGASLAAGPAAPVLTPLGLATMGVGTAMMGIPKLIDYVSNRHNVSKTVESGRNQLSHHMSQAVTQEFNRVHDMALADTRQNAAGISSPHVEKYLLSNKQNLGHQRS